MGSGTGAQIPRQVSGATMQVFLGPLPHPFSNQDNYVGYEKNRIAAV
jgi:hypothetical protein